MQRSTSPEYAPNRDISATTDPKPYTPKHPGVATRRHTTTPHDDATNGAMRRHATRAMRALTRYDDDDDARERCSRARRTNERIDERTNERTNE